MTAEHAGRTAQPVPRALLVLFTLLSTLPFLGFAVLAWGDWRSFFAHPARLATIVASLVLAGVAGLSGMSLGPGRREAAGSRWIFLPVLLGTALLAWVPPFAERRGVLVLDGDAVRYLGLLLFVAGGVLRVWPMFTLGRRFSPFVAIQEQHGLVTEGPYRLVRHPSYLGALLALAGWVLVFRSGLGLLVFAPAPWLVQARIDDEERLLASEFGEAYDAYRRRTPWRLLPGVY